MSVSLPSCSFISVSVSGELFLCRLLLAVDCAVVFDLFVCSVFRLSGLLTVWVGGVPNVYVAF